MKQLFPAILKKIDNERIEVYKIIKTTGARGQEKKDTVLVGTYKANIQSTGSQSKVQGLTLEGSDVGNKIVEVYNVYTFEALTTGQQIKRIDRDGLTYDVRSVEPTAQGMPLAHYKGYIVRVDNQ
jgi:hypothetical protein